MRRGPATVAALLLLGGALTACAGTAPAPTPAPPPSGLSLTVYQPRPDVAAGRFALQVVNTGNSDVVVTAATLSSPDFAADVVWTGDGSTVRAGLKLDLRVPIPRFACDRAPDLAARLTVTGSEAPIEVTVDDPFALIPRLHAEDCIGKEIAAIAALTPREVIVPDGKAPAILVIDVAPTGATGSVEIVGVRGTTLLQPADAGVSTPELALGVVLSADGPAELRVPLLPNRCDAHALAEDKVGTIIPFLVAAEGTEPVRWMMILPDELKGALYGYFAAFCDLDVS